MRKRIFWAVLLFLIPDLVSGQIQFHLDTTPAVEVNNQPLANPWAGGLNAGQYGQLDLNGDGIMDLVVFDRSSNRLTPFLNIDGSYQAAPEYAYFFPSDINGWVLFRDYNCDGLNDIFTDTLFGIKVYLNTTSSADSLSWVLVKDPIFTEGFSGQINLQLNITDLPAIDDLDGDGDLDILVYDFSIGGYIRYHRNLSIENFGVCDSLVFRRDSEEWGDFMECSCDEFVFGDEECPPLDGGRLAHAGGKSLLVLDTNADGDMEIGLGQELCNTFYVLENVGTTQDALIRGFIEDFPAADRPLTFPNFPAAFYLDIDLDGTKDLMSAPNVFANSADNQIDFVHSSWLYLNQGTDNQPQFVFSQDNYLQDGMIDLGEEASPALYDIDSDGDLDLLVGSRGALQENGYYSSLHLYLNIGTQSDPRFSLVDSDYLDLAALRVTHLKPYFADLDGDKIQDLVLVSTSVSQFSRLQYLPGSAGNGFSLEQSRLIDLILIPDDNLAFTDMDNDQITDILVGRAAGRLEYWRGNGQDEYSLEEENLAGIANDSRYRNLAPLVADLNSDGSPELLTADAGGRLRVYPETSGSPGFNPDEIEESLLNSSLWEGTRAMRLGTRTTLVAGDLNRDGALEIILGDRQGGLLLLHNDSPASAPTNPMEASLEFTLYPNPTSGLIKIRTNQNARIEVFTVLGQKVIQETNVKGNVEHQMDFRNFPAGIYLVQGRGQTSRSVQKIVIQK